MYSTDGTRTTAFSDDSIEEIDISVSSELEQIEEHVALIESFRQPFPLRARGKSVMDGEMDSYG